MFNIKTIPLIRPLLGSYKGGLQWVDWVLKPKLNQWKNKTKPAVCVAKSLDPNQMPHIMASDLGLHCLLRNLIAEFYCIGFPMADLISFLFYSCFVVNHIYHKY